MGFLSRVILDGRRPHPRHSGGATAHPATQLRQNTRGPDLTGSLPSLPSPQHPEFGNLNPPEPMHIDGGNISGVTEAPPIESSSKENKETRISSRLSGESSSSEEFGVQPVSLPEPRQLETPETPETPNLEQVRSDVMPTAIKGVPNDKLTRPMEILPGEIIEAPTAAKPKAPETVLPLPPTITTTDAKPNQAEEMISPLVETRTHDQRYGIELPGPPETHAAQRLVRGPEKRPDSPRVQIGQLDVIVTSEGETRAQVGPREQGRPRNTINRQYLRRL